MSSSPFELFRRNLKPLMVFLTGLALFAFVVLPVMDSYMRQNAGAASDDVVASYDGTTLTRARVEYFTRNHSGTIRFLRRLAEETINRGGSPKTAGFSRDPQSGQIQTIGINESPSFETSIRTLMLANEAQQAGFELDDPALRVWLEQFTDQLISPGDINAILMDETQNQMGRPHLYEQLRNHLLANVYLSRGYAGLYLGDSQMTPPLMTPQEQWENFLKLNQNAVASAYGVMVNDYLPQTNKTPSEEEMLAVFEEGKTRPPSDQSDEPAFFRPYEAEFEYLVGVPQSFIDAEVAQLTEEEIRAEYDRRLKGGEFQVPEIPEQPAPAEEAPEEPTATEPASAEPQSTNESPNEDGAAEDSDAAQDDSSDAKSDEPESESDSEDSAAAESEPAETEPAEDAVESDNAEANTGSNESPADESSDDDAGEEAEESPEATDQSLRAAEQAVRLVAAQQEDTSAETSSAETSAAETPAAQEENAAETTDTDTDSEDTETADTETAKAESTDTDETETGTTETDADVEPAAADTAAEEEATDSADDEAAETETLPFEEVRDEIAQNLARPAAMEKLNAALARANAEMRTYFNQRAISQGSETKEAPEPPKLQQLAEELGLEYEAIGPYTRAEIREEPIADSVELGSQFGMQAPDFSLMMYGLQNAQAQISPQPLFAPVRTTDPQTAKQYVSWKVDERQAYVPQTLEEVREEVVMAIRMREARELAKKAAQKIAEQAEQSGSLADVIPEAKQANYYEGLGPFSWMNSLGLQGATIGNVRELDSVGDDFMRAVFTTDVGGYNVAANQPGRVVYVVSPTRFEPSVDQLRQQFLQPTNRMMAMLMGGDEAEILSDFYENVDEEAGFTSLLEQEQAQR